MSSSDVATACADAPPWPPRSPTRPSVSRSAMSEPATLHPVQPDAAAHDVVRRLRILVVDDDRTLREGCANILQLDGHQVTVFSRGEEAIEAARRQHFDIALVDLYMTPVSGMDV